MLSQKKFIRPEVLRTFGPKTASESGQRIVRALLNLKVTLLHSNRLDSCFHTFVNLILNAFLTILWVFSFRSDKISCKFRECLHFSGFQGLQKLMPSPSAFSKFGLSILKFFKHAHFFYVYSKSFWYTQKLDFTT